MELNEMSLAGKKKFTRWIGKQTRNHNHVCVSKLVASAPSEFKLFKMCRFIDKCYAARQEGLGKAQEHQEVSTQGIGEEISSEDFCDGLQLEENNNSSIGSTRHETLPSATQIKYDAFSRHTKSRILDITNKRMDIPISRIITDAVDEDDVIRVLDEIESREVPVNPEVRKWTVKVR